MGLVDTYSHPYNYVFNKYFKNKNIKKEKIGNFEEN